MSTVLDYSSGYIPPIAFPAHGHDGAIRYLPKKGHSTVSVLTESEVHAFEQAGVELGLVYEDPAPGWMLGRHAVGIDRAHWCKDVCQQLGITPRAIYFADDTHRTPAELPAVMDCVLGLREVLGGVVGIYGFRETIAAVNHNVSWRWLTGSPPSNNEILQLHLNLYQHNYDNTVINGITCDINTVYTDDWGQLTMSFSDTDAKTFWDHGIPNPTSGIVQSAAQRLLDANDDAQMKLALDKITELSGTVTDLATRIDVLAAKISTGGVDVAELARQLLSHFTVS